jgi:WD40 repeat protein
MTFSTDFRTLAVATSNGQVLLYDLTDRRHPRLVSTTRFAAFTALAFSPDGHTLASSDGSGRVEMWDMTRPAAPIRLTTMTNRRSMSDAAPVSFSPDGNTLVAGGSTDRTVTLWDVTDRAHPSRVATVAGHNAAVTAAAISADGRTLATQSQDHVVLMWDITDRSNPIRIATLQRPSLAGTMAFSPDSRTLATGFTGTSANLTLWDYSALNRVRTASATTACAMTGRGFTADEWARAIPEVKYQRTCTG